MPYFSIIIPSYNAEQFIERCINSVHNQKYFDYELIIVNDGSTDKTLQLIEPYENSKTIIINQDNEGVSSARNKGLKLASGRYIIFLDSDDWILEGYLDFIHQILVENSYDGLILGHYLGYGNTKIKQRNKMALNGVHEISGYDYGRYFLEGTITNNPWDKVFLKELYVAGMIEFPTSLIVGEDAVVMSQIGLTADKIGVIPEGFLVYMSDTSGVTKTKVTKQKLEDIICALKVICNVYKNTYAPSLISYMAFRQVIFYIINSHPTNAQLIEFEDNIRTLNKHLLPSFKWKIIHSTLLFASKLSLLSLLLRFKSYLYNIKYSVWK
jgi:glycosyltransferase involved in cell wall biosynthesis